MRDGRLASAWAIALAIAAGGCQERPPKVPGETDIHVESVEIVPAAGKDLELSHDGLFDRLGMRPGTFIKTERTYSEFREAEDRRRIEAFWQTYGYFDVEVAPPKVTITKSEDPDEGESATVVFAVRENVRYTIGSVDVRNAGEHDAAMRALVPFAAGEEDIDLERFRKIRVDMQESLRRSGHGHANVYSRTWVDKQKKVIHWVYYVDAGPKTKIASIVVKGNVKVPADRIIERSGLEVGEPFTEDLRDIVVADLLDSGAFAAAFVRVDTDTKFIVPGTVPDSGGELRDEQVDADGNLVPRKLPEGVNVTLHVVEAPSQTVRVRAAFEIDPERADTYVGALAWFRNLFAPMHHLVLEGRAGWGFLLDEDARSPGGPYGEALVRTIHEGVVGRLGDLRLSARYRGDLFPSGAYLHALSAGPGLRVSAAPNVFFDLDLLGTWSRSVDFGPFTDADRERLALPDDDDSYGAELQAGVVWDARNKKVEPTKGHFLSLRTRFAPGPPLHTHRFVNVAPEARGFIPLGTSFSVAGRASGEWAFGVGDDGLPLGARLFGGGAHGFRGHGRDAFSPLAVLCDDDAPPECSEEPVGGLSLVESSLEVRFLPPQKQYGAVVFGDFGGAGADLNPFEDGPSFALGLGLRLRLWYLPAALDVAYRLVDRGEIVDDLADEPFRVFFRIGEAF